jgi:hypothetical protein
VVDEQPAPLQRLMNDASRIEGVKSFASMLHNQQLGLIVDRRNGPAKTELLGAKTANAP